MKHFRWWHRLPYYAPDGGGGGSGGGSDDGGQFGDLGPETVASAEQVQQATTWLSKEQGFDPKSIEGKQPNEIWNLARTSEQAYLKDPWKGTEFQGLKVPDKFVELKDGRKAVKVADIVKGYGELEQAQFRRRDEVRGEIEKQIKEERAKAAPATPGDYTPAPSKMKFKGADGAEREAYGYRIGDRDVEVIETDPAFNFMREVAHKYGLKDEEFHGVVQGYITAALSSGPKWSEESKALGGELIAEKREGRVASFLKGNLSAENYAYFASMPSTARSIQAIEQLMTLSGHPAFVPDSHDIPGETYTRAQLAEMQRDPRYTGEGRPGGADKAFVAQVRAGFKRLAAQK